MIHYTGSGAYCYANSLHMSLRTAGMNDLPTPGFLECLTAMPFGKLNVYGMFFPSGVTNPDSGLTLALQSMGWTCDEHYGGSADDALAWLHEQIQHRPVLVGPLGMEHLTYNPEHAYLEGADHFIVVLEIEGERLRVHDPAGYAYASLPMNDFMKSWCAERVPYGRVPFVGRSNFRPVEPVSRVQMIERTITFLRTHLPPVQTDPNMVYSTSALRQLADDLRGEVSSDLGGHLLYFALPLAARRLDDASAFLIEGGQPQAAACLAQQSRLFGEMIYLATHKQWSEVAARIDQLIPLEEQFERLIQA